MDGVEIVVASDVSNGRDGIGVEVSLHGKLLVVVFRDDTKRTREVTLYQEDVPLEIVEEAISIFKKKVPWEFIEYSTNATSSPGPA